MNFFWAFSARKIKLYSLIGLGVLFALCIWYAEGESIQGVFSGTSGPEAIYNVNTDKKQVSLTFDISWGEKRLGPILSALEEKGVKKATFFVSSVWAKAHSDLVKEIVDNGYELGNHGHQHDNYSQLDEQKIKEQLNQSHSILTRLTGKKISLIRYPNGDFDKRVLRIADSMGYTSIQWDTDSLDWMNPGTDKIVKRVVGKVHPGDIIHMHASDSCEQTHEALPLVIDQLRDKGYDFVTVSELITETQTKTKSVK